MVVRVMLGVLLPAVLLSFLFPPTVQASTLVVHGVGDAPAIPIEVAASPPYLSLELVPVSSSWARTTVEDSPISPKVPPVHPIATAIHQSLRILSGRPQWKLPWIKSRMRKDGGAATQWQQWLQKRREALVRPEMRLREMYNQLIHELQHEVHRALGHEEWMLVSSKPSTKVWKRQVPSGSYGSSYPCLKVSTVVDASMHLVVDLIMDSERVNEYNRYTLGREDVEHLGPMTKVVVNRTLPPLSKKAHEFCTLMHVMERHDGSQVILSKYTEHPKVPRNKDCVRSEILLGVTEVKPHPEDPNKTQFTTISHVKTVGLLPLLAEQVSIHGLLDYIHNLEKAIHRRRDGLPSQNVREGTSSSSVVV